MIEDYSKYADEMLIQMLRNGQKDVEDYIMEKYKGLVRKNARAMFLIGGENDDLIQEGMIGLFKAIRDYNLEQEVLFYSFANLCITRQIYSAVEASNRKKHKPLNSYVSLDSAMVTKDEYTVPIQEVLHSLTAKNPEEVLINKEEVNVLEAQVGSELSKFERQVLHLYLSGKEYVEIAKELERSAKSVDNALGRIKMKLGK
jgi:RNA polymerase sigma factor, sigma-70 family